MARYKKYYPDEYYLSFPKIYYLAFDNIPFYIGVTSMPLIKRLTDSRNDARENKSAKDLFILDQMYNHNKVLEIHLLEVVTDNYHLIMEEYWIWQFKTWGFSLYNTYLSKPPKKRDKRGLKRYHIAHIK